ncbi:MAG TPA: hypothetical protein VNH84_02820 [Candidatus Saccharimonadales bacterium]|nr:hypothetical protein [Candidatus Saccharimonadales bacterium]
MPIASIGGVLRVTPEDEIQIFRGAGDYEFVDDKSPFKVRVTETLLEDGVLIGVIGPIIEGHPRYSGLVATLLTRIEGSNWELDMHSGANFVIGPTPARRVPGFPHYHPEGTAVDGYPVILRYGGVDADVS